MIDAFRIDDQDYVRIGEDGLPTSKGRIVKVALWQSVCPDCGATFVQHHRTRAFNPAKRALRRCPRCRRGPGKRVRKSRNSKTRFSPLSAAPISPGHWPTPRHASSAQLVPGTSKLHACAARPVHEPRPPKATGVAGWALLDEHSPRLAGQSTRPAGASGVAQPHRADGTAYRRAGAFIER
jgi:hypothetical protein